METIKSSGIARSQGDRDKYTEHRRIFFIKTIFVVVYTLSVRCKVTSVASDSVQPYGL